MIARRKRGGRKRRGAGKRRTPQHTSQPTSRTAYADTREWLLAQHGPVCAYCGHKFTPRTMTLDHVAPRRGQSAYDRRDNLVLSCKRCNTAKADKPFLAYLLGQRSRAKHLLEYGTHLSDGILKTLRNLVGEVAPAATAAPHAPRKRAPRITYGPEDGESPYRDG